MRRFWQRWSYWDLEDKLVWVGKRIVTLLAMAALSGVAMILIVGFVILSNFLLGAQAEDVFVWASFAAVMAANYYMLDGVLWD